MTVDGAAVSEDAALPYDAAATGNHHLPDAGARDASDIQDSADRSEAGRDAGPPDTGPLDTGVPDTRPMDGGCAASGYSGVLATFELGNQPGGELSVAPTATANGVSGSSLSRSISLVPNAGSGSINSSNWPASFDPSRYYTFSVTPSAGCTLSLTTLSPQLRASASGPSAGGVATNADTFATRQTTPTVIGADPSRSAERAPRAPSKCASTGTARRAPPARSASRIR